MERLNQTHLARPSLFYEHAARYEWASRFLSEGITVDCACGEGYGTYRLSKESIATKLIGIDISPDAIAAAKANYQAPNLSYHQLSFENLPSVASEVSTFTCFETIEHTDNPNQTLEQVSASMAEHGLLLGSVPSSEYEMACERIFGPNPFHLQKFSIDNLKELLQNSFAHVWIGYAVFGLGTVISGSDYTIDTGNIDSSNPMGSLIFLASNSCERFKEAMSRHTRTFYFGIDFAHFHEAEVIPLFNTIADIEKLVDERDSYIKTLEQSVNQMRIDGDSLQRQLGEYEQKLATEFVMKNQHKEEAARLASELNQVTTVALQKDTIISELSHEIDSIKKLIDQHKILKFLFRIYYKF